MDETTFFRPWHLLRPNHARYLPRYLTFVDTEAHEEVLPDSPGTVSQSFRLGCAIRVRMRGGEVQDRQANRFDDPQDFWEWFLTGLQPKSVNYLFAHNLSYDIALLRFWDRVQSGAFSLMEDTGYDYVTGGRLVKPRRSWRGCLVLDDPPTIIAVRYQGKTIKCVDTYNYWRCSLSELAQSIGMKKMTFPGFSSDRVTLSDYCMNDVAIIQRAVCNLVRWWNENDLGTFRPTAAGLAWSAFRHRFMDQRIWIHGVREVCDLEREAYRGGRCEAFYVGPVHGADEMVWGPELRQMKAGWTGPVGPVYVCDIRSAYASVMRWNCYPTKLLGYLPQASVDDLRGILGGHLAVARVRLHTPEPFPVRLDSGQVAHATGDFWTALATPELQRAMALGAVIDVGPVAWYERGRIFDRYVKFFWSEKCKAESNGHEANRALAKLLLCSLYGKFGQKRQEWEDLPGERPPGPWGPYLDFDWESKQSQVKRAVAGKAQRRLREEEADDSFPAIAAHVTSYLRERLLRLLHVCGGCPVYYVDTDSIHTDRRGCDLLVDSAGSDMARIGSLKVTEYSRANYYGPKHYELDGKIVLAGLTLDKSQITADGSVQVRRFERARSITNRRPDGTVRVRSQAVRLPDYTVLGTIGPDGWVSPMALGRVGRSGDSQSAGATPKQGDGERDAPGVGQCPDA